MSILSVFHHTSPDVPHKVLTHQDDIAATLLEQGVGFSHQPHALRIRPGTDQLQVRDTAGAWLDALMTPTGCTACVLLNRDGAEDEQVDVRGEHIHPVPEVFAVISGRAVVGVRRGDHVFAVLCEKGDVLTIPEGTGRWIDLGDTPFCLAARLFRDEQGAQPRFTGNENVRQFTGMSEL